MRSLDNINQVQIESPFNAPTRSGIITNVAYALLAMRDSLNRGEAPFASHLLYTLVGNDNDPYERELGILAGLAIGQKADATAVYTDLGISPGMVRGIEAADAANRPMVYRRLFRTALSYNEIIQAIHEQSPLQRDVLDAAYARIIPS